MLGLGSSLDAQLVSADTNVLPAEEQALSQLCPFAPNTQHLFSYMVHAVLVVTSRSRPNSRALSRPGFGMGSGMMLCCVFVVV